MTLEILLAGGKSAPVRLSVQQLETFESELKLGMVDVMEEMEGKNFEKGYDNEQLLLYQLSEAQGSWPNMLAISLVCLFFFSDPRACF